MTQSARALSGGASVSDLTLDSDHQRRGEIQLDALDFPELQPKSGESP